MSFTDARTGHFQVETPSVGEGCVNCPAEPFDGDSKPGGGGGDAGRPARGPARHRVSLFNNVVKEKIALE